MIDCNPRSAPTTDPDVAVAADSTLPAFVDLGLSPALLVEIERLGYVAPTPIQARTIPSLLAGRDVFGQAQTGTGKTAAFALPILTMIDLEDPRVQALVLAPTRELAVQVAEMIQELGRGLGPVGVLAIYGGDSMERQLRRLQRPVRIVVGTPGRLLDHLRRGTLDLGGVRIAILDEGDEMLRMGFLEDVEAILEQVPASRQMAIFSATLPGEIVAIGTRHLRDPEAISVPTRTLTVASVDQQYMFVEPYERVHALARLLAVEDVRAALVFARTRAGCGEVAEILEAAGFPSEAMHGDLSQPARESVLRRLRNGQLRILVATDVAARGLDIEHVDLVVNLEFPQDPATYVHRIGRTARAGRHGRSVLLLSKRETGRLRQLERFTGQKLAPRSVPTASDVESARLARFAQRVRDVRASEPTAPFRPLVQELLAESSPHDLVAALIRLAWGDRPIPGEVAGAAPPRAVRPPAPSPVREVPAPPERAIRDPSCPPGASRLGTDTNRVVLSLGVGRRNGVEPRNIVGAIVNEAAVPGSAIGGIEIRGNYSLVEVVVDVAPAVMERMQRTLLCGRYLQPRIAPPAMLAAVQGP